MDEIQFRSIMEQYEQDKVLEKFETMNDRDKERILKQCDFLDFSFLNALSNHDAKRGKIEPIRTMKLAEIEQNREKYEKIGLKLCWT